MSFKEYGVTTVNLAMIVAARPVAGGTAIFLIGGSYLNVSADINDVKADLPAFLVMHAASGGLDVLVNKDAVASFTTFGAGTRIRFEGGVTIDVSESYADVKTALGV